MHSNIEDFSLAPKLSTNHIWINILKPIISTSKSFSLLAKLTPRREKCNDRLYKKIHLKLVSSGIIIGGTKVGLPWLVGSCTTSRFSCSILVPTQAPSWTMHPEPQLQSVQNKLYTGEDVTSLQRFTFQF